MGWTLIYQSLGITCLKSSLPGALEMCFIYIVEGEELAKASHHFLSGWVSYSGKRHVCSLYTSSPLRAGRLFAQVEAPIRINISPLSHVLHLFCGPFVCTCMSCSCRYARELISPLHHPTDISGTNGEAAIDLWLFAVSYIPAFNYLCTRRSAHLSHQWSPSPTLL